MALYMDKVMCVRNGNPGFSSEVSIKTQAEQADISDKLLVGH